MGKKKQVHATQSFSSMVGKANQEALKPYVEALVGHMADDLSKRLFRRQADVQVRLMAIESILMAKLGITEAEINTAVADTEDKATGYKEAFDRGAKAGDLLRISIRTKKPKEDTWTAPQLRQVTNLMNDGMPPEAPFSLGAKELEEALVGAATNDVREVVLHDFTFEMTINRISKRINTEASK